MTRTNECTTNSTILLIVESPSKCRIIERYLVAAGYTGVRCIASCGHFRAIDSLDRFDRTDAKYIAKYKILPEKRKTVAMMKQNIDAAAAGGGRTVVATDDDREGEAIGWHICDLFKLNVLTTDRIKFREITPRAIVAAFENPTRIHMGTVHAQMARSIVDVLIGFRVSPVLWDHIATNGRTVKGGGLSAGRCQTPALRILNDIETVRCHSNETVDGLMPFGLDVNNVPIPRYKVIGYFTAKKIPFRLIRTNDTNDTNDTFNPTEFLQWSQKEKHRLTTGPVIQSVRGPPSGFSTVTLQRTASSSLGYSPKRTMVAAQELYEAGHITYMRTESTQYSDDFVRDMIAELTRKYSAHYTATFEEMIATATTAQATTDTQTSNSGHEAIRPTVTIVKKMTKSVSQDARRLYELIRVRTCESLMRPARIETIVARIGTSAPRIVYEARFATTVFPGWKTINGNVGEEGDDNNTVDNDAMKRYIQSQEIALRGDGIDGIDGIDGNDNSNGGPDDRSTIAVSWSRITCESLSPTTHPLRMTESRLIGALESRGIGRPSTYASIVETIKDHRYVKLENVPGTTVQTTDWEIGPNDLLPTSTAVSRVYGAEKSKLVVQPIGRKVADFLDLHFGELFAYNYTARMEKSLDAIVEGKETYSAVCAEYDNEISRAIEKLAVETNESANETANETATVRTDRPYEPTDRPYEPTDRPTEHANNGAAIGRYDGSPLFVKKGKYGYYAKWGKDSCNLKKLNVPIGLMTVDDVVGEIERQSLARETSFIRTVNRQISVRHGKAGDYIMYSPKGSRAKPKFVSVERFLDDTLTNDSTNRDIQTIPEKRFVDYFVTFV